MKFRDFIRVRIVHAFRHKVTNTPGGTVMVLQPKNISVDGRISFGSDEPLRTDAPSPRLLQPNDVLMINRGRFAAAVFDIADARSSIVPTSVLVLSLIEHSVLPGWPNT